MRLNRHLRRRAAKLFGMVFALSLLANGTAEPQTSPGLVFGQVPTAGQWNSYFAAKTDFPWPIPTCSYVSWTAGVGIGCNTAPTPSATVLTTTDNGTSNATYYPTFTTAINGSNPFETDSSCLSYNPLPGIMTSCGYIASGGGTTQPPLQINSATVQTTPNAGSVEYDGNAIYGTPSVGLRGNIPAEAICVLANNYTLTNGTGAQQAFNCSAGGSVTLAANTTYRFEAVQFITNTGTASHTWALAFIGTAVVSSMAESVFAYTGTTSATTITPLSALYTTTPTVTVVTAASASATENVTIKTTGIVRIGTGGTLTPSVKLSAAPGGTQTMLQNSYFRIYPIGSNTVATVGKWS